MTEEPRLFRVSRVEAAFVADEPAIRRDGVGLANLWEELRRQVDERPTPVRVTARVRRSRLDMFCHMYAAHLGDPAANGNPPDEARQIMSRRPTPLRAAALRPAARRTTSRRTAAWRTVLLRPAAQRAAANGPT